MDSILLWFAALAALLVFGLLMFALGTRTGVPVGGCKVDTHWWFGWWVRCVDEGCAPGKCVLLWRRKGTDEHWSEAGVVPGGSVKWNRQMEYKCECQ